MSFKCKLCLKIFTKKSNLQRHWKNFHQQDLPMHHHGLQFVDAKYLVHSKQLYCELHNGKIGDGKLFHCFACNFSVCSDCMEEDNLCSRAPSSCSLLEELFIESHWLLSMRRNKLAMEFVPADCIHLAHRRHP